MALIGRGARVVGRGACARELGLDLVEADPRLVVLLDEQREVLIQRVEFGLGGRDLLFRGSGGGESREADSGADGDEHGNEKPCHAGSPAGHLPPATGKAAMQQPGERLSATRRGVKPLLAARETRELRSPTGDGAGRDGGI